MVIPAAQHTLLMARVVGGLTALVVSPQVTEVIVTEVMVVMVYLLAFLGQHTILVGAGVAMGMTAALQVMGVMEAVVEGTVGLVVLLELVEVV